MGDRPPMYKVQGARDAARARGIAAGPASTGWTPEDAVVCSWKARICSLNDASLLLWPARPVADRREANQERGTDNPAYLRLRQMRTMGPDSDTLETAGLQWFSNKIGIQTPDVWTSQCPEPAEDPPPAVNLPPGTVAGDGPRWRGKLSPSLFMSAVAVGPSQQGRREHGEQCGRANRRVVRERIDDVCRNEASPPGPVGEALVDPADRLRLLVIDAQLERMAAGPRADRLAAVDRLVSLGCLPTIPMAPSDPIRQTVDAAVRQSRGIRGLRPFLQELRATLPDGLDSCAKSAQDPSAHGFKGLTAAGRRSIRDACTLLRERLGALVFGTITLPDAAAESCTREQLATFQSRWLFYARRMLVARGLDPLVVVVAELHPNRKTLAGQPITHWHYCAPTAPGPMQPWAVSVADWHKVHRSAYLSAFGHDRGHNKGCRTEPARKDPGRYLSKYLSKARSDCSAIIGTPAERCIPRQWWSWTGELRHKVAACRTNPPAPFLAWCVRWRSHLEALGECSAGQVTIGEEGPCIGWWFGWQSIEALDRAIRQWLEDDLAVFDHRERAGPGQGAIGPDPQLWLEPDDDGELGG